MPQTETERIQAAHAELIDRVGRKIREDGALEAAPGLSFYRSCRPTDWVHSIADPAFCVIAQGSKEVILSDQRYRYDPAHYLLGTVGLPVVSQVVEASPEKPYLSIRIDLDSALVGSAIVEAGLAPPGGPNDVKAIVVSTLDADLLDATLRLVRLLDAPSDARLLAPLIRREIVFRLLAGEQGGRLRHMAVLGGHAHRIAQAVGRLRQSFDQPLRIESLARDLGMSLSGFHHHFKAVTDMSPLQFQKQLRLQEARRLMLSESLDASSAGYRVGYEDASHFSREYKRLFGESPIRDVERLRESARVSDDLVGANA